MTSGAAYPTTRALRDGAEPGWAKVEPGSNLDKLGKFWLIRCPDGTCGSLAAEVHTVTEHEDGTITVEPSLMMPSGWHGWLRRGVFTDA